MAPKRPPPKDDNPYATAVDPSSETSEDLIATNERRLQGPPAEDEASGATAFVRVDRAPAPGQRRAAPTAPPDDDNAGATAFVRVDQVPQGGGRRAAPTAPAEDDNAGATAFVRIDAPGPAKKGGAHSPPPRRPAPQGAPKKGLQVQLPDDEPVAPKPKPRPVAPPATDKKGRRGAWWDEEADKLAEEEAAARAAAAAAENADSTSHDEEAAGEHDGATSFGEPAVQSPRRQRRAPQEESEPEPEPEPQIERPKRRAQPAPEEYKPVPADDYEGHLSAGPPSWKVWLRRAVIGCVAMFLIGIITVVAAYVWISRDTPELRSVSDYKPAVTSKVVAQDGTVVGEFFREKRTVVKMDVIPRILIQAVTAAEDKDFYKHPGVNFFAMMRAFVVDAFSGRKRLGASTITQQVVKNLMLTRDKKIKRKLKEVLLAWRLERDLSKDDILYLYLNDNNFGKGHYGVEEAAQYYFGKHIQDIDLGEAALLAGLPQNPARLNPRRHPDNAKRRQIYVLDRMLADKMIDQTDHDREVEKPLALPPLPESTPGAWYVDEVRRQLVAQFGDAAVDSSGWTIEVGMNPALQAAAEQAVQDGLRAVDKRQGYRGPRFKVDAASLSDLTTTLAKRLSQTTIPDGQVLVADLDNVAEKDQLGVAAIARAADLRALYPNGFYAGVVTAVSHAEATVQLAPGVSGPVPFSSMAWARPFSPEQKTAAPSGADAVLAVGDVIAVKVANLRLAKTAMSTRVAHVDFTLDQDPGVQAGFAAIDLKTRNVLALVGGADITKSQFNRATQARRQPGSSFKPFLYAAAIESGKYTPVTKMDDSPEVLTDPWTGKTWKPQNFEKDQFDGPITLRKALAESKNTVAVKLLLELGLDKVRAAAANAGLTSPIPQSYTAALGTGEVGVLEEINAYATLATQGRYADPIFIRKVTGRDGSKVLSNETNLEQKMRADVAYVTADMMRAVLEDPSGTAHWVSSALGRTAAGKTGTASEHRDGWFIGFTPSIAAGAWVGFDDHNMMGSTETGGHCAAPIWLSFMRAATANTDPEPWPPPPPGVATVRVNRNTGAPTGPSDPFAVNEVFLQGTEPAATDTDYTLEPPDQDKFYQEGQ